MASQIFDSGGPMAREHTQPTPGEGAKESPKANTDPRSCEHCQFRIETKVENLGRELDKLPTKIGEEFMKLCTKSEKQLEIKSKEADDLMSELQSVKEQLEKEGKIASTYSSEVQSLRKQLQDEKAYCRDKVAGLTITIRELDEDKKKLRKVILGNTVQQKISDDDIKQRFANLRQQIQALANNLVYELHPRYRLQSRADWVFGIRSSIFISIHYFILSRDIFGLAESCSPAQHDPEDEDLSKLNTDIHQLCENAFSLRLLTRQSDDRYQFETPEIGEEYDPTNGSVEAYGVIGGGEESNIIAIPFCGALMKYTVNEDIEIACVLEPAQVVLLAKETKDLLTDLM
ncbi:hypothetical protein E4U27_002694 [Claviceps purpurea]|nr:hypothetical protein E4U27_002694 [Claviceps purpurea]